MHRVAHRGRLVVQVNPVGERGDVSLNGGRGVVVKLRVRLGASAGRGRRRGRLGLRLLGPGALDGRLGRSSAVSRADHRGGGGLGGGRGLGGGGLGRGLGLRPHRLDLSLLVGQANAGLTQLTQYRAGLAGRQSRLLERSPKVGKGQVTLAATALDEVIHARRARLLVLSRSGSCDPRHETPASICCTGAYGAPSKRTRLKRLTSPMTISNPARFTCSCGGHS